MQSIDRVCIQTPAVCHVASMQELQGKQCTQVETSCPFGQGCSSCRCECQGDTLLWRCECNPC